MATNDYKYQTETIWTDSKTYLDGTTDPKTYRDTNTVSYPGYGTCSHTGPCTAQCGGPITAPTFAPSDGLWPPVTGGKDYTTDVIDQDMRQMREELAHHLALFQVCVGCGIEDSEVFVLCVLCKEALMLHRKKLMTAMMKELADVSTGDNEVG